MSDCCSNPKVGPEPPDTVKDDTDYKLFNPGEVRLYGRPVFNQPTVSYINAHQLEEIKKNIEDNDLYKEKMKGLEREFWSLAREIFDVSDEILYRNTQQMLRITRNDVIVSIDNGTEVFTLPINVGVTKCCDKDESYTKSIGIIYGYAYEGHCYKLPKPQIMLLPDVPLKIENDDCGCDCGYSSTLGYAVWRIDKLSRAIALDIRSDDIKTLILEANTPGSRSPLAYSQAQALAPHRPRE